MMKSQAARLALVLSSVSMIFAPAAEADDAFMVETCTFVPGSVMNTSNVRAYPYDIMDGQSWEPTNMLDTQSATWSISAPVVCAGTDLAGNAGSTPDTNLGVYDFTASGTSRWIICANGSVNGQATLSGGGTTVNMTVSVTFVNGQGDMSIVVNGGVKVGALGTSNAISGGSGRGVLNITPVPPDSCAIDPGVENWLLNGSFYTTLQG